MKYKKSYYGYYIGVFCGLIIILGACYLKMNCILLGMGIMIFIGAPVQACIFFRCPKCDKLWLIKAGIPDYCPHCGEKVDI